MIGLGTQDNLALAEEFVARYDMTATQMLWEDGFETWRQLGITGQPAAMLFDSDGEFVAKWVGVFEPEPVLAALDGVNQAESSDQ